MTTRVPRLRCAAPIVIEVHRVVHFKLRELFKAGGGSVLVFDEGLKGVSRQTST
jgi:hypothetical protein